MRIISIRSTPSYKDPAILFFQKNWPSVWPVIYEDCINHSIGAKDKLPQWYLLEKGDELIGCAGLITNDFISRGDLYPWLCALFISEKHRGNRYSELLIEKAKEDTKKFGYEALHLCTDHVGLYEKFGFEYVGQGYHPWEEQSRIYQIEL